MITLRDAVKSDEFEYSDGKMIAHGVLARTGVQLYDSLALQPNEPRRMLRVYRPHSEVFDKASMESFEGAPVTLDHPDELVNSENWKQYAVGDVRDVRREGDFLVGTVIVRDASAIQSIRDGINQLSNGYGNMLDFTPGVTPSGEEYDAIQRQIRGNHVAIVKRARCGDACKITNDEEDENMEEQLKQAQEALAAARAEIAALTAKLAESTEVAEEEVAEEEVAEEEVETLRKAVADSAATIAELKSPKHVAQLAKDWSQMLIDGGKILPSFSADNVESVIDFQRSVLRQVMNDANDSRKALILAVTGGKTVCDAEEIQVQSAFRLLAAVPTAPKGSEVGKKFLAADAETGAASVVGMASFHARLINGFKA